MTTTDIKQIMGIAGAFIAFMIGSGFATGQEILQYFAAHGVYGLCGIGVCLLLLLYASAAFVRTGYREQFERPSYIYVYYFGKRMGSVFDYFTVVSIYLCYIVMIAGAGAAVQQHFSLPIVAGGVFIGIMSCVTVMFGLQRMVDIIGKIGPFIIIMVIGLAVITIAQSGFSSFAEASSKVANELGLMRASSNWFLASLSYLGISIVWLATFMTALGSKANSLRNATAGSCFGVIFYIIGMFLMSIAFILNMDSLANTQIPTLIIAQNINPVLATIFAAIVLVGIYTTAVPLLWTAVSRFAVDKTKKFSVLTCIFAGIGTTTGMLVPFNKLVNIVYVLIGYLGFVLIVFIVLKQIRTRKW